MKKKVLFIDDDLLLGSVITLSLQSAGYETHYQTSITGLNNIIYEFQPNVIVLDVEIGASNGIDAVPTIQAINPNIPIIFVSSHVESSYATRAINSGAEIYLRKPFETEELIAYIKKYTTQSTPSELKFGENTLNLRTQQLTVGSGSQPVKLTAQECKLLKLLILNIGSVVERTAIEVELYGESETNEYSINNSITKLRKHLSSDPTLKIQNIYKVGFKLVMT